MRIPVIEGEAPITEILQEALSRAGFTVDSAIRCAEARDALSVTAYDAAVLDLGEPDGDGRALLADLQSSPKKVLVLVLTARDAVEDRISGLDAGANDYLVKPFFGRARTTRTGRYPVRSNARPYRDEYGTGL
jgi:DNA-binding response OmpR family regulator